MDTENDAQGGDTQHTTLGKRCYNEQVFVGVVIGVTGSLIFSVLMGIFDVLTQTNERREQTVFLRGLANEMQNVCVNTKEWKTEFNSQFPISFQFSISIPADRLRDYFLRDNLMHFQRALEGRATRLTFDEIYELDRVSSGIQLALKNRSKESDEEVLSEDNCSILISGFKKTWLLEQRESSVSYRRRYRNAQ